jgi:hypothetical protein
LIPPYTGGLRPLTAARLAALTGRPVEDGWWAHPVERATVLAMLHADEPRAYSTELHPRDVTGELAISCERREGRVCGPGAGLVGELTSSAGYRDVVSVNLALRGYAGNERYDADALIDRAFVEARLGPVSVTAGRDVLVLGPGLRTQVAWGTHAPPVDLVRVGTAEPVALGSSVRGSVQLALVRLREPQIYPGALVGISRFQLDLARDVSLGGTHLLQFNGEGAGEQLGVVDFILEHFRRKQRAANEGDSSNRRVAFDVAVRSGWGALITYEVAFEDVRKYFHDAIRHEADHLLAVQTEHLLVELGKTGYRSQEHTPRTTGFTNRGFLVGSPLGPDTLSVYLRGRLPLTRMTLYPWIEAIRLANDQYQAIEFGPLTRIGEGLAEKRFRIGARAHIPIRPDLWVDVDAMLEHTSDRAFVRGASNMAGGITAALAYRPAPARR